jgi:CRP/FNR family transcriptional regulator
MTLLDCIDRSEFFKGISDGSKKALARLCRPVRLKKKDILFGEGDRGHSLFMMASGTLRLFKSTPDGKEVVIKIIQPAEIFGEVILFEEDRYPVSAVAVEPGLVYRLPRDQFHSLLGLETFRNDFIAMLMRKQRYLAQKIVSLAAHDVEERFFRFLAEQYGKKEEYTVTLSKKDVAAAVGTIPETLSRLILRLKKEGVLTWTGSSLRLQKGFWLTRFPGSEEER